jgi:hypothetical protein
MRQYRITQPTCDAFIQEHMTERHTEGSAQIRGALNILLPWEKRKVNQVSRVR